MISGTSTDVGKTVVTAALAAALRAAGQSVAVCKPAQTGVTVDEPVIWRSDQAQRRDRDRRVGAIPERWLPTPPLVALRADADATRGGRRDTRSRRPTDVTLVEGAGGLLVRFGVDGFTVRDVAAELGATVVVVAAAGLAPSILRAQAKRLPLRESSAAGSSSDPGLGVGSRGPLQPPRSARRPGSAVVGRVPRASRARTSPDSPRPRPRGSSPVARLAVDSDDDAAVEPLAAGCRSAGRSASATTNGTDSPTAPHLRRRSFARRGDRALGSEAASAVSNSSAT
ncbi:AAA family ATPase [Rhodococcus hoagii]|nr:AAA family ATPase [Prescottella equi]